MEPPDCKSVTQFGAADEVILGDSGVRLPLFELYLTPRLRHGDGHTSLQFSKLRVFLSSLHLEEDLT